MLRAPGKARRKQMIEGCRGSPAGHNPDTLGLGGMAKRRAMAGFTVDPAALSELGALLEEYCGELASLNRELDGVLSGLAQESGEAEDTLRELRASSHGAVSALEQLVRLLSTGARVAAAHYESGEANVLAMEQGSGG